MTKLEELERELEEHWKRTEKERSITHTKAMYLKLLKNKEKVM